MSFKVVTATELPQVPFQYVPQEVLGENAFEGLPILGGILSDLKHIWHAKGPCLEVRNIASGRKVGSWTFGGILRDSNTKISGVEELKRAYGRLPLLVVALDCPLSGGLICVFDVFGSKVVRVVQIEEQITNIHVVDSSCEIPVLPDSSPLKYFDGIVAIGTLGGNVFLLDLCKQICENVIQNMDVNVRDEVNPCQMVILKKEKVGNIKKYVERSMEREEHLAIHLNVVLNPSTEHFTLKGENDEDRVHVNRTEAEVSALFYSPQIASLLVGYNFGAFQMWNLRLLELIYTSPICEGNIPVTHFTVQEPADDPKAYCYVWVSYSHNLLFHSGLPFAVMYSFYFDNKKLIKGYGNLYEDFQHCSIRFQMELSDTQSPTCKSRVKGGTCLGLLSINKCPTNKDVSSLSLCLISWLIWDSENEVNTGVLLFDLNQWYKEQMPRIPNWSDCSNYIVKNSLGEHLLDVKMDQRSLSQFMGIQRLEEHFCPTSLSFDLWGVSDDTIIKIHNKGHQKEFLNKIVNDQHLALVRPEDYSEQIVTLGLVPLFCDGLVNNSLEIDHQRDFLLSVALEQKLIGWLCQATAKLANDAFSATGLSIYTVLNWAFQRAITLKNSCDNYCVPLFDHSGMRLDDNTLTLIACGTSQIRNLCSFYQYVSNKLLDFVSDKQGLLEEQRSLENVVVYFEVLLWMVNIGLLPEYQPRGSVDSLIGAPYLVQDLTQFYNKKRAQLQMATRETFVDKDCLLFIDNMINNKGGADILRQQWQEDGGSGMYPPPSLQSVLRTYFLDGPDLVSKHSLVTYTLLDIAMTVDEHNKVIKLLLKFPQIFDLTQSNIKIVQAFWHLDHDDYETALESILDPCVLPEDLQQWHHSVMMRSLLMQDQHSLALLYLQIRKPCIQDEKDLLTVISLLVSKNMLDEAFKFRLQHEGSNDYALLTHIFNECNKNELLHTLLYRRMNTDEEKVFFKYLQGTRNPRCEDLKVFYYLLRSRFLEAFDTYSLTKRRQPDTQGLMGQRDATTADNIVKMFKALLPDINRNLVELVRKERTNLWKEVQRPQPLSVFVHNAQDQVHYKSSVIFAALAKAKQTFNETLDDTKGGYDVVTEDTPFLRTPRVFKADTRMATPLLRTTVIERNQQGEEFGPSPCKKLKLSPRASKTSPIKSKNISLSAIQSKLSTPIIKRKRRSLEASDTTSVLPHSILKSVSRAILDDSIFGENTSANTSLQAECENSIRRSGYGVTSRKAVRTPLKSHVKFDDLRYSGSSTEQSSKNDSQLTDNFNRQSKSSNGSVTDDVFYSPDHSFEEIIIDNKSALEQPHEWPLRRSVSQSNERLAFDDAIGGDEEEQVPETPAVKTKIPIEERDLSTNRMNFQSPRSRRSYKRSFDESSAPVPMRSSPRLSKKPIEDVSKSLELNLTRPESPSVQRLRGRRSLSRSVLEHNAFSLLKGESKNYQSKSTFSSANTTFDEADINDLMDTTDSTNASLEAYLAKFKNVGGTDSSFDSTVNVAKEKEEMVVKFKDVEGTDSSFDSTGHVTKDKEEVVASKTTEVSNVETRRESLRRRYTGPNAVVSFNEIKEEFRSKTVEVVGEISFSDPPNIEDSKAEEISNAEEDIDVYDDLSSASEDLQQVLQDRKEGDSEKTYRDISFSTSFYQTEKKEREMPDNILDSGESSNSGGIQRYPEPERIYDEDVEMHDSFYEEVPETERAFIDNREVIEICSSSEEERSQDVKALYKQETSSDSVNSSSSSSSSRNKSYSSSESYNLNLGFEHNQNEEDKQQEDNSSFDEDQDTQEVRYSPKNDLAVSSKEIADAINSIAESDEEHMESLLLEEAKDDEEDNVAEEINEEETQHVVVETCSIKRAAVAEQEKITSTIVDESEALNEPKIIPETSEVLKSIFVEKHSVSLQCTLGAQLTEAQINQEPLEEHVTKDQLAPPEKQSRSLQCTLGARDVEPSQLGEGATSNLKTDMEKHSISLQCTLGLRDVSMREDSSVFESATQYNEGGTPLVLRTVKKTYQGRKPSSHVEDVDGTPKLAVELTKRTYSRMKTSSNIFEKDQTSAEVRTEEGGDKVEETENKEEAMEVVQSIIKEKSSGVAEEIKETEDNIEVKQMTYGDLMEQDNTKAEDVFRGEKEVEAPKTPASSPAKKDEVEAKELPKVEAASVRVTRRRSILLSQQDATMSSVSEESVASGAKSGPEGSRDQSQASQMTTSQSSQASSRTRGSKRLLSESMFDNTFLLDTPLKQDVMDTSLLEDKSKILAKVATDSQPEANEAVQSIKPQSKKRGGRKLLSDLDAPMDLKETDGEQGIKEKDKSEPLKEETGSSKIYARRSSKTSKNKTPVPQRPGTPRKVLTLPTKRARSASVGQPLAQVTTSKRSIRCKSIDLDDMTKVVPEVPRPSTSKDVSEEGPKYKSKPSSHLGDYSTSRRLTRRQASMLETIGRVEQEVQKLQMIEEIDPVLLLDKKEFDGGPDPDEAKIYEHSSPSDSSETPSRHTRSASVLSDATSMSTPTKGSKQLKVVLMDSTVTGIKSRLRKPSTDTMSVTSEQSDSPSPSKKSKKKEVVERTSPPEKVVPKTRRRANSVSSTKSVSSDKIDTPSARSTRSRRIHSAKSELPEIREEKGGDEGDSANNLVVKRPRQKKKE